MSSVNEQRLVAWEPTAQIVGKTTSFGEFDVASPDYETVIVVLPFEEGRLHLQFKEARAFLTVWDGDECSILTMEEAGGRPSDLLKLDKSRWLASENFNLGIESSGRVSAKPWQHFCIIASERALHIAARDEVEGTWVSGTWSGAPGAWIFTPTA